MILVFDLDDTLYDEASFVDSGLTAVAQFGESSWGIDFKESQAFMRNVFANDGRARIFDRWLLAYGQWSKGRVNECVRTYRQHAPSLSLFPEARQILDHYKEQVPLYMVTDGHKYVQQKKISALRIWNDFSKIFITHRYGLSAAKPSTVCFEKILLLENCKWEQIVYVGDDPSKDFVGLNRLGAGTIRVLSGRYRNVIARKGYDAATTIGNLGVLPEVLSQE